MKNFVNANKIIEAYIAEPYNNTEQTWHSDSHGWQLILVLGFLENGYPEKRAIDLASESECIELAEKLGLTNIN